MSNLVSVKPCPPKGEPKETVIGIRAADHFAIFLCEIGWNLTHIASGKAIVQEGCCAVYVMALAERIAPLIDWTADFKEIQFHGRKAKIHRVIAAFKCPSCDAGLTGTDNNHSPDSAKG